MTTLPLDCAPIEAPLDVRLSDADLERIEPLQRVLLSPLDSGSADNWRRAVNRILIEVFGSDAAMFQLDVDGVSLQLSEEFDPATMAQYTEEFMPAFAARRRLYRRSLDKGAGNRSIMWGSDLEWLYDSAYFNELVVGMRAFDPLWASAPTEGATYPAMIHTYRDRRGGCYFDERDVKLMELVRPALEAGVRTVTRTAFNRTSLIASLEARGDGALVYDVEGELLYRNPAVGALATTPEDERALAEEAREMALSLASASVIDRLRPSTASRRVITRTGDFALSAVRLGEGMFRVGPTVLVTVPAGGAPLPDQGTLRRRFGLTRRQAEVCLLLARLKTDPEVAELLGISVHTARHHAEAVMGKLGLSDRRRIAERLRGVWRECS